ncbi:glutamate-cysteine ligase [Penicillium verrucosum]|uniref:glutamate-cysteine ligase n=1 Tax=Penicillium verrucosum TaxID=60171 RepID=UPI002545B542|nr:glutamate-cysteine ligase [Penicillium verrucosum]KAJ5945373.1 glutamate-cysteine ligase [Penicillium verrucosum]
MQYMIEMIAAPPFGPGLLGMLEVEKNLEERRKTLQALLGPGEFALTLPVFPLLGTAGSVTPSKIPSIDKPLSADLGHLVSEYERWRAMADNMKSRRGRPFEMSIPNALLLDDFGYAFGGCALQVTLQAKNLDEACQLHDQMSVLGPLMLAMTAATPGYQGFLANTDTRWDVFRLGLDDRTSDELLQMEILEQHEIDVKIRVSTSPIYLSAGDDIRTLYQSYLPGLSEVQEELESVGMDKNLACHFAQFLQYDPLLLESDHVEADGPEDTYHFRSLYRSIWPHIRLKVPEGSHAGWRVEFRPMEAQLTDFENAAFIVFTVLLRHMMEFFNLSIYIPMRLVVENMQAAVKQDAVLHERFWFSWQSNDTPFNGLGVDPRDQKDRSGFSKQQSTVQHLSMAEIFCGSRTDTHDDLSSPKDSFQGFIPLIEVFLRNSPLSAEERAVLMTYITFIGKRASGELWTDARWMRHVIRSHRSYRHDSVVTSEACYDLLYKIKDISQGELKVPELF